MKILAIFKCRYVCVLYIRNKYMCTYIDKQSATLREDNSRKIQAEKKREGK